ncbi:MAG: hypothetical protein K0S08_905 [Gammaproteobacteria bacterium]|jgi:hypothetical protein|nr:hypothetical protein [Gammaproteobacteria bacterium]
MPTFNEALETLKRPFEALYGKIYFFCGDSDIHQRVLAFLLKKSQEMLNTRQFPSGYSLKAPDASTLAAQKLQAVKELHAVALQLGAATKVEQETLKNLQSLIDSELLLADAVLGIFSPTNLTKENLIYFWLALIVNQQALDSAGALACFLVLKGCINNIMEMDSVVNAGLPRDDLAKKAYKKLLPPEKARPDLQAGGQFYRILLGWIKTESQRFVAEGSLPVELIRAIACSQPYPIQSESALTEWTLASICSGLDVIASIDYLFVGRPGESRRPGDTNQRILRAVKDRLSIPPSPALISKALPPQVDEEEMQLRQIQSQEIINLTILPKLKIFLALFNGLNKHLLAEREATILQTSDPSTLSSPFLVSLERRLPGKEQELFSLRQQLCTETQKGVITVHNPLFAKTVQKRLQPALRLLKMLELTPADLLCDIEVFHKKIEGLGKMPVPASDAFNSSMKQ